MMGITATESTGGVWLPKSRADQQKILAQMEMILASQHFIQSKHSQLLFRYIIAKTLAGQVSVLKERTLGIEVFNRTPDYDTHADPIVRMTAAGIRKRIAQYYFDSDHRDELRIDLPSGSYIAQFHLPRAGNETQEIIPETSGIAAPNEMSYDPAAEDIEVAPAALVRWTRGRSLGLLSAGLLVAIVIYYLFFASQRVSSIDLAWGDILTDKSPSLICLGRSGAFANADLTSNEVAMSASQHVTADSVSYSEVQALVRILKLLEAKRVSYRVQPCNAASFGDLRQSPTVLIGGLNNQWTLRAQENLRYRLTTDGNDVDSVVDARDPSGKRFNVDLKVPYRTLAGDYAIVARFHDPTTQQATLIVAGLGENGTKAAGEFITDEKQLQEALGQSLQASKGKNFEVVLGTQVINQVSGPPKVLAKEVW